MDDIDGNNDDDDGEVGANGDYVLPIGQSHGTDCDVTFQLSDRNYYYLNFVPNIYLHYHYW